MDFCILGPIEVTDDGDALTPGGARLRQLLAIFLVRPNEVVSADRLVEDLWGDATPANPIPALHTYVSHVRRLFGREATQRLVTRRPGYLMRVDPDELDATRFERSARAGQEALAKGDAETATVVLGDALGLWRGEVLEEFAHLSFARGTVSRLEELRAVCVEDRAEALLSLGRAAQIVAELEANVRADPLRERRSGQLMLALYRANRQADALRAYQDLRALLREELGIDPSPALAQLEAQILRQEPELQLVAAPDRDASRSAAGCSLDTQRHDAGIVDAGDPIVGRAREREDLAQALERLGPGSAALAVIVGEAGIGKTRLGLSFADDAAHAGAAVLFGRCDAADLVPYRAFVEAIEGALAGFEEPTLVKLLGTDASIVARHVPGVARRLPHLPEPRAASIETERYWWFEAVVSLLVGIVGDGSMVLLIDDLHEADSSTLALLRHLLRHPQKMRLMIVATLRDDDAGADPTSFLADVQRDIAVNRIELAPLGEGDIATIIERNGGTELASDRGIVEAVTARTRGNPFFVIELARHLRETARDEEMRPDEAAVRSVPGSVRDVVSSRLARLPAESIDALRIAAVLGDEFDASVLARVTDQPLDVLADSLDPVEERRFIRSRPGPTYSFSHAIVRDVLYAGLGAARRQTLHERIAKTLEGLQHERGGLLSELAYHACLAAPLVDPYVAIDFARRAGDEAASRSAFDGAAQHYRRAIDVLSLLPSEPELRAHLLLSLGEALHRMRDPHAAKLAFLEAADCARSTERSDLLARAALGYGGPAQVAVDVGDPVTTRLIEEALDALGEVSDPQRALLLGRLAQWLHRVEPLDRRRLLCDEAVTIARQVDDDRTLAAVLNSRYWALYAPDSIEERLAIADELVAIATRLQDPELELQGEQCRLHAAIEGGDVGQVRRAATRRAFLVSEVRQPLYLWGVAAFDAQIAATQGSLDEADELARAAFELYRDVDFATALAVYVAQLQQIRWLQGRMEELIPVLSDIAAADPERPTWHSALAWAYAESGALDRASDALDELAGNGLTAVPRNFEWLATMAGAAIACRHLGDAPRAAEAYELLLPYQSRNCAVGQSAFYGAVEHHLGALSLTVGQPKRARLHLERAVQMHGELDARPFVALTKHELRFAV
jgi:DNA-binding SARP family transcriptional activator